MWLVAVVGRCVVGCEHSTCFVHHYAHLQENKGPVTAFGVCWFCCKTAPHNRYQPHPAEPEQHTKCSNRAFVLLKMGIMMPETCWDRSNNEHLIVASCWSSLFILKTTHFRHNISFTLYLYFSLKKLRSQNWNIAVKYTTFWILVIRPDYGQSLLAETCSRILTKYHIPLTDRNTRCYLI